jgi:hypothetical protein
VTADIDLQVEYEADAIHLDLLGLAREGHPLISRLGEVPFVCQVRYGNWRIGGLLD